MRAVRSSLYTGPHIGGATVFWNQVPNQEALTFLVLPS